MLLCALSFCGARLYLRQGANLLPTIYLGLSFIVLYLFFVFNIMPLGLWWDKFRHFFIKKERLVIIGLLILIYLALSFCTLDLGNWANPGEKLILEAARIFSNEGYVSFFDKYSSLGFARRHPPLPAIFIGGLFRMFGESTFTARTLTNIFSIFAIFLTYLLAKKLYGKETALMSMILLSSLQVYFRYSWLAEQDIAITCFFTLVIFLFMLYLKEEKSIYLISAIPIICLGILMKYTMILILPIILLYLFFSGKVFKKVEFWVFVIFIMLFLMAGIAFLKERDVLCQLWEITKFHLLWVFRLKPLPSLVNHIVRSLSHIAFGIGIYNILFILAGIALFLRRKIFGDKLLLIWVFIIFFFFAFTCPVERRYFLPAFPALSIIIVETMNKLPKETKIAAYLFSVIASYFTVIFYFYVGWFPS